MLESLPVALIVGTLLGFLTGLGVGGGSLLILWLTLVLASVTTVLTPIAAEAGEWLEHKVEETEALEVHEHLGKTMLYFSLALLVAAILMVVVHVRSKRGKPLSTADIVVGQDVAILVASREKLILGAGMRDKSLFTVAEQAVEREIISYVFTD